MNLMTTTNPTPEVCQSTKKGVTQEETVTHLCEYCHVAPAKKRFCSSACRQANYRKTDSYKASLKKKRDATQERKNEALEVRRRDVSMTFDGRQSGSLGPARPRTSKTKHPSIKRTFWLIRRISDGAYFTGRGDNNGFPRTGFVPDQNFNDGLRWGAADADDFENENPTQEDLESYIKGQYRRNKKWKPEDFANYEWVKVKAVFRLTAIASLTNGANQATTLLRSIPLNDADSAARSRSSN